MKPLAKKQTMSNDMWLEAMRNIEDIVSKEELDLAVNTVIEQIRKTVGEKSAAYAWSAGKDSIVLGDICEKAGIQNSMIGICELEYPLFRKWIQENKPAMCEVINTGQDLEWLKNHENMLFPQNSTVAAKWFAIVQHTAQRKYFKNQKLDILILGRRKADGNYVGGADSIYTDGKGITRYSPLSAWKHEYILAYIHYYNLPMPPIYGWKNGYLCGTHPWPARQWTKSVENGWSEIYDIDKNIVLSAADYIDSAKRFLEGLK